MREISISASSTSGTGSASGSSGSKAWSGPSEGDRDGLLGVGIGLLVAEHGVDVDLVRVGAWSEGLRTLLVLVDRGRPAVAGALGLAAGVAGAGRAGEAARRLAGAAPGLGPGADQADQRPAAEQQNPAEDQEQGDDVRADALEESGRGPVEALADHAAVSLEVVGVEEVAASRAVGADPEGLGGECEQQAGDEQQRAGVDRAGVADQRPDDQGEAHAGEQHRQRVGDRPGDPGEPGLQARAGGAAVPARVEDEAEVEAERDQGEPDQIEVPLLELARLRAAARFGLAAGRLAFAGARLRAAGFAPFREALPPRAFFERRDGIGVIWASLRRRPADPCAGPRFTAPEAANPAWAGV